jgi:WD40 repeat protein
MKMLVALVPLAGMLLAVAIENNDVVIDERGSLEDHKAVISALLFSSDSKSLLSTSFDGSIRLWDIETMKEKTSLNGPKRTVCAALCDGVKLLATGGIDKTIVVWDVGKGQEINTLKGHSASVACLAMRGDCGLLVSGSADGTIKLRM